VVHSEKHGCAGGTDELHERGALCIIDDPTLVTSIRSVPEQYADAVEVDGNGLERHLDAASL
jgi:hypothetical protein